MADMDYLVREKMSVRSQQKLNAGDWDFLIDFSGYVGYHPDMEVIQVRTTALTGVNPTLTTSIIDTPMRGFHVHQPGFTDNHANAQFTINLEDFEDQSIKLWFLDWQNKMDSLTTHKALHRKDLMVDMYVWRLNVDRQRVWEMHYVNCLPNTTDWSDDYSINRDAAVGKSQLQVQAEMAIPTPLNLS